MTTTQELIAAIERKKITRYRIAKLLNVAHSTVNAWHKGRAEAQLRNAVKLARLAGKTLLICLASTMFYNAPADARENDDHNLTVLYIIRTGL